MASRVSTGPRRTVLTAAALGFAAILAVTGCGAGQVTQTDSAPPAVNGVRGDTGQIALRDAVFAYESDGGYHQGHSVALELTIVNTGAGADELVGVSSPVAPDAAELIGDTALPGRSALRVEVPEGGLPDELDGATDTATDTADTDAAESTEDAGEEPGDTGDETETAAGDQTTGADDPDAGQDQAGQDQAAGEQPEETGAAETGTDETSAPETSAAETEIGVLTIVFTNLSVDLPSGKRVPVTFNFANADPITLKLPVRTPSTPRPEATEEHDSGH